MTEGQVTARGVPINAPRLHRVLRRLAIVPTVTVTGSDGVTRTWTSPAFTVDREDLLITSTVPANPTPLLWDPDKLNPATGAPDPLPLSAAFHAACKATVTATVRVYTSDQVLVRTLTKALLTTDGTTDAGGTVLWDGRGEPANGQPGAVQPRGVYLLQWTLTDSLGLTDSDKSAFLSLLSPLSPYSELDLITDPTGQTYKTSYVLSSFDQPAKPASAGQIDVFDLTSTRVSTLILASQDLTPGAHSVSTSVPGPDEYVFLVSPLDQDASSDRGGRNRYALQHNQSSTVERAAVFGHTVVPKADVNAIWNILSQGFYINNVKSPINPAFTVRAPNTITPNQRIDFTQLPQQPRYGRPSQEALDALQFSVGRHALHLTWTFIGHGSGGNALDFDHNSFLVADRIHDNSPTVGSRYYIEDFPDGSLHNVTICVMAACTAGTHSTVSDDTSRIGAMLRKKGVQHTINFNQHITVKDAVLFTEHFWMYANQGNTPGTKNSMRFREAAQQAEDDVIALDGNSILTQGNGRDKSFVQFDGETLESMIDNQ